jgi:hypothetical protein
MAMGLRFLHSLGLDLSSGFTPGLRIKFSSTIFSSQPVPSVFVFTVTSISLGHHVAQAGC